MGSKRHTRQDGIMATKRDASITFFPVGNADTSIITLSDGATIVIDVSVTADSKDENEPAYDVHGHLLRESRLENNIPHVDAFILTHPDQDHVRGFTTTFFTGDPSLYTDKARNAGRIIIDELWFTPRIFCSHEAALCEEAKDFRREAHRRMELHRRKSPDRVKPGNRLRVIGYSDNADLEGLDEVLTVPGNVISTINSSDRRDFECFVHAPFKDDTDDEEGERNHTSVVLQARFAVDDEADACLAILGGDAGCPVWERILDRSDERSLRWDILLAPHHCSWTFFSESPSDQAEPSDKVLRFLDMRRDGAVVVVSSKPILDDDDNPPHFIAAKQYRAKVGPKNLLSTAESKKSGQPVPIVLSMTKNGPVRDSSEKSAKVTSAAAIVGTVSTPRTYG